VLLHRDAQNFQETVSITKTTTTTTTTATTNSIIGNNYNINNINNINSDNNVCCVESKSGFYSSLLESTFERPACATGKCPRVS